MLSQFDEITREFLLVNPCLKHNDAPNIKVPDELMIIDMSTPYDYAEPVIVQAHGMDCQPFPAFWTLQLSVECNHARPYPIGLI